MTSNNIQMSGDNMQVSGIK